MSNEIEKLLPAIEDVIPSEAIEKFDRDRKTFLSLVGHDEDKLSAALLDGVDYGPDRASDISARDTPVKKQDTPQCSAYATIAAMENLWGAHVDLSEHDLWETYRVYLAERAIECAHANWVPTEKHDGRRLQIQAYKEIKDDFLALIEAIEKRQHPCVAAISVPAWMSRGDAQVEDGSKMLKTGLVKKHWAGHAVEVVGYKIERKRPYFYVKNSWGASVGKNGYQWLSFHQFKTTPGGYVWFWEIEALTEQHR